MFFVTEDALIICKHPVGIVERVPSQGWFTVANRRVLVDPDPENRKINGCANGPPPTVKPCFTALKEDDTGYSTFIRVGGQRVCLDTITGFTDGNPPGLFKWVVTNPGQPFVEGAK